MVSSSTLLAVLAALPLAFATYDQGGNGGYGDGGPGNGGPGNGGPGNGGPGKGGYGQGSNDNKGGYGQGGNDNKGGYGQGGNNNNGGYGQGGNNNNGGYGNGGKDNNGGGYGNGGNGGYGNGGYGGGYGGEKSTSAAAQGYQTPSATYAPPPPPPSNTYAMASTPSKQTVKVGQNGLTFTPDNIIAKIGDEITFEFFPKNHSVVQSTFANPCNPSEGGIFSGFIPSTAGAASTTFTIKVTTEKPIWLYCGALKPKPHCASGMVAAINAPATGNTLEAFRGLAMKTNTSTFPATPNGGTLNGALPPPAPPASTSTPPSASGTPPPPPPPPPAASESGIVTSVVAPPPPPPPASATQLPSAAPFPAGNGTVGTGSPSGAVPPSSTTTGPLLSTGAASSLVVRTGAMGFGGLLAVVAGLVL